VGARLEGFVELPTPQTRSRVDIEEIAANMAGKGGLDVGYDIVWGTPKG
jgi:hypothetical protein